MASRPTSLLSVIDTLPEEWHAFFAHTSAGGVADPTLLQRAWRRTLNTTRPVVERLGAAAASSDEQTARRDAERAKKLSETLLAGTAADADSSDHLASLSVALLLPTTDAAASSDDDKVPLDSVLTTFVGSAAAKLTAKLTGAAAAAFPVRFIHTDDKSVGATPQGTAGSGAGVEPFLLVSELHAALRNLRSCLAGARSADVAATVALLDDLTASVPPPATAVVLSGKPAADAVTRLADVVRAVVGTGATTGPLPQMGQDENSGTSPEVTPLTVYCQFPWAVGATSQWGMGRACEPQATRDLDDAATEEALAQDLRVPRLEVAVLCHTWDAWAMASAAALRRCTMSILLVAADSAVDNASTEAAATAGCKLHDEARSVLEERFAETILNSDLLSSADTARTDGGGGSADADLPGSALSQALFPWTAAQDDLGAACKATVQTAAGQLLTIGRSLLGVTVLCAIKHESPAPSARSGASNDGQLPARVLATVLQRVIPAFAVGAAALEHVAARRERSQQTVGASGTGGIDSSGDAAAIARAAQLLSNSGASLVSARRVFLVDFAVAAACVSLNADIQVAAGAPDSSAPGSPHAPASATNKLDKRTVLQLTSGAPLSDSWARLSQRRLVRVQGPQANNNQPNDADAVLVSLAPKAPQVRGRDAVVDMVVDTVVDIIAANDVAWRASGVATALQSVMYGLFGSSYFVERAHHLRSLSACGVSIAKPLLAAITDHPACPRPLKRITEKINETRRDVLGQQAELVERRDHILKAGTTVANQSRLRVAAGNAIFDAKGRVLDFAEKLPGIGNSIAHSGLIQALRKIGENDDIADEIEAVTEAVAECAREHSGNGAAKGGSGVRIEAPSGQRAWDVGVMRAAVGLPEVTQRLRAKQFASGVPEANDALEAIVRLFGNSNGRLERSDNTLEAIMADYFPPDSQPPPPKLFAPPQCLQPSFLSFFHAALDAPRPGSASGASVAMTIATGDVLSVGALDANYRNAIAFVNMLLRILDLFQLVVTQAAIEMHDSRQNGALLKKRRTGRTNNNRARSGETGRPWMNAGATSVTEDTTAILKALVELGRTEAQTISGMLLALRACVRSHNHETEQLVQRLTGVPFGAAGNPGALTAIMSAVTTALIPPSPSSTDVSASNRNPRVPTRRRRHTVQLPDASVVELSNIVRSLWELHDSDDNLTRWYMDMCEDLATRGGLLDDDIEPPTSRAGNASAAQTAPMPSPQTALDRPKAVLCLCGGGVRGVITAVIVDALDEISYRRHNLRIWDLVDEMIGTSTGAIVAALLCCGVEPKRVLKLYLTEGRMIFPTDGLLPQIKQVVAAPRYDPTLRGALVRRYLGNRALNDRSVYAGCARPKLTTFEMGTCTTRVWTEHDSVSFADVLTAASAAPTYFPSHRIGARLYCDGGMCENHPGLQVILQGPGAVGGVVCIGTGESIVDVERLANKGQLGWATSVTSVMMGAAQWLARRTLEENFKARHVHLNPSLPRFGDFDLAKVENTVPLLQLAREYVSQNAEKLEHAVTVLYEARRCATTRSSA